MEGIRGGKVGCWGRVVLVGRLIVASGDKMGIEGVGGGFTEAALRVCDVAPPPETYFELCLCAERLRSN